MTRALLWLRRDLRLDDLPALHVAARHADEVVPLFVADPTLLRAAGPNRRRYLAATLAALNDELGGTLVLRRGDPHHVLPAVAAEIGATLVSATADFGPHGAARDQAVAAALATRGCELRASDSPYLLPPGTLRSSSGTPFRVYGAFRRALEARGWAEPVASRRVPFSSAASDATLAEIESGLGAPPAIPAWWEELAIDSSPALPPAGAGAARERLARFVAGPLARYAHDRDRPALAGTSGLSADLHFGAIHPRTVAAALGRGAGAQRLRDELVWRDFYADVLWHFPHSAREPLQRFGAHLRWDDGPQARARFAAWALGRTGFPLVDAGMRQLLAEGWMHNRVRMVTASFLVKDLHIDWRLGARWFMWQLIDGDLASNQHGWQWVAGTGTDAAPFHRVMNPELQRERFDPDGAYVRRYLGEEEDASPPPPIVEHARERRESLERFANARAAAAAAAA